MKRLLQFNPEPFESEFEGSSYEYNEELDNSEWEAELEIAGRRGRARSARAKSFRPQRSGIKSKAPKMFRPRTILNPYFSKQKKVPGLVVKPKIRFPIIPFIPPVWPVFPFPGRIPEKNEPAEPGTSDRNGREPGSGTPPEQTPMEQSSEYVRWVQSSLNQIMKLRLTIDGILNAETRSAIRGFQERRGLPVTGFVGPDTEQALKDNLKSTSPIANAEPANYEPSGNKPSEEFSWGSEAEWEFGGATGRIPRLLKEESTPPGTTLYIEINLGIVDKFGIKAAPMTGVFIPQGFKADKGVDVIFYLHGHKGEQNRRLTINQYWDRKRFAYGAFREGVNDSARNVILVAPTLGSYSESGALVKPGGLDAYLDQVLSALAAHGPANLRGIRFHIGSLVLSCHSGGGWPMRQLAGGRHTALAKLRECWGFDCTYNRGDDTFWANWARLRSNAKVYIYYIAGSKTGPLSESLRKKGIVNAIVMASRDKRHNYVPITYWRERISGAGFLRSLKSSPPTPISPAVFSPIPVETPGGGRIQDKRAPAESMLMIVSGVAGKKIKLHKLAGQAWQVLVQAARADGIRHPLLLPTSGYRSPQYQEKLWKQALARYKTSEEARKWVAPPGGSAHQSGRAIDFYLGGKNSSDNVTALRQLSAYKWLIANASRFGFYPYPREPWHWEYNPPARSSYPAKELEMEMPSFLKQSDPALTNLASYVSPSTSPTVQNAVAIVKAISALHGLPWRLGYTILQHEGGVKLFKHNDGVMQTTRNIRKAAISHIPRALKLVLLGKQLSDKTSDTVLSQQVFNEFPKRLAVQIAAGIQELKDNLDRFNGYVALALQAYNAGSGWAYYTATQGKQKSFPKGMSPELWESMCRFGSSLLHQLPHEVKVDIGVWQCDANIPAWFSHIPVRDRHSGLSLVAYKYLRSIAEKIRSGKPANSTCTWPVHGANHRQPGTGAITKRKTRDGALDKLYMPQKLGRYYTAAKNQLPSIIEDNLPLKVLNGRLVKMPHASGRVTPIAV